MSFTPHGIIKGRGRPRRRRAEHRVVCHERQPADLAEDAGQSREGDAGARLRARRARPGHDQQPLAHHRSAHRNHGDHARRGAVPILRAIRATAKEHGYDLIRMSSTCTTEDLADMRRLGKGNLVDAFIMLDIRHHDGRLKSAMKLGLPIVPYGDPEFPFINIFDRESVICAERHGIQLERFEAKDTRWQSFEPLTGKFPEWKGNGVCIYTRSPRTLAWIEQMMLLTGVAPGKDIGLIGEGGRSRHRADRRQGIRARRRTHAAEIHPPRDHDSRIRGLRPHKGHAAFAAGHIRKRCHLTYRGECPARPDHPQITG